MRRAIITLLVLLSFGLKAQVYQAMPQAGYGPVKRMLFDSVLTIPLNINQLRNITGGRDAGQIRYNVSDSGLYVFTGYTWIKANLDSVNLSNRINGKLNISDTAYMLSWYMRKTDTLSLSNRINLRVKYTDTAAMLDPYLRKLDTASLSRRIDEKQNIIKLTTNFKSGAATLIRDTLNIPKYSDTLQDNYVPYLGAIKDVDLGAYKLNANTLTADYLLQAKNSPFSITPTSDYTSITPDKTGFVFYTSWLQGQSTYTQSNRFNYANQAQQNNTREYNLPVRNGTLALVEDTVNLSNRINLKADKSTVLTINGVGYDLSANRTWTIPTVDTTSLSNRINLRVKYTDTASMLSPYLRKADTSSLSNRIDLRVKYSDTAAMLSPYLKSAVTSVGLSMPNAFNVTNSPITSTGTIAVTGAGTAAQYIRGDGQLATLPTTTGSGSSVNYYLNGGVSQGTIGGSTYYEMSKDAITSTAANFDRTNAQGNGLIAQFITDVNDPNRLEIPGGAWNFELFFSASSSGGTPAYYVELLKYDGSAFTLIASNSTTTELITGGTATDLYLSSLAVPYTTLAVTDRLVIRVYVITSGKTITLHTQNGNLCQIVTTFSGGLSSLNGLTANTQYLSVGTAGTDFAISSLTDTHTFNLPTASATNRGALSSADWSTFNGKMNYSDTVSLSNRINTKLNSSDTASLSNRINAKADALSGTTNTVSKFTSSSTIGNSNIKDDGNTVSVSTTAGSNGALQVGNYNGNILMNTTNTNAGLIFKNTSSSNKLWDISSFNNDLNFNESNISPTVMTLKAGGDVLISSLIGSGTRMVVASSTGVLSTQAITGVDTTSLSNRINLKLNISDTASMLSGYQSAINSKQVQINGTGFVKASGTTISYDNSTYYLASNPNGYTSNTGTVTSVGSGLGLSGGTITTSGTLLVDTASTSILSRQRAANTYYLASNPNGYTSNTGTVTSVAALTLGTSGTDLSSTVANNTTTPVITLNVPTASATNRGALSSTDWSTFNNKQNNLTNPVTGTGTTNYLPKFTGTSTIGNSAITDDGSTVTLVSRALSMTQPIYLAGDMQAIKLRAGTSTGYSYLRFYNSADATRFYLGLFNSGGVDYGLLDGSGYKFEIAGTPIVLNNNAYNVLIGTPTDAGYKLDVNGTGRFSGNLSVLSSTYDGGAEGVKLGYDASYYNAIAATFSSAAASNKMTFVVNSGNGTRGNVMTLVGNGNVGIGTTSPSWLLNLEKNSSSSGAGQYPAMVINNPNAAGYSALYFFNNTTNVGGLEYNNSTTNLLLNSYGALIFQSGNGTERLRITIGGVLDMSNNSTTFSIGSISGKNRIQWDSGTEFAFLNTSNQYAPTAASAFNVRSDYRLKEDLKEVNGLQKVLSIKTYDFKWIDSKLRQDGVLAHELQEILPYAVSGTKDQLREDGTIYPQGVDYGKIVPVLIKAIQELSAQIKELQTKIQTLENK